jgi:DNA polymerase-1
MAMLAVYRAIGERGLKSRMLLQVHDELIFEVAPGEFEALRELVNQEMSAAADLRVPLEVSTGSGHSWWDAAH